MNAAFITLSVGLAAGLIGIIIRHILMRTYRSIKSITPGKPSPITKNLRLLGGFERQGSKYYYHTFCFGPLPLVPIGCYSGTDTKTITGRLEGDILEILSLYLRWGWIVAAFSALILIS
jgi:hypothetical protein